MTRTKLFCLAVALAALLAARPGTAAAQSAQRTPVGQVVSGLVNVNIGAVALNVGDITLEDLVDVEDVLNRSPILSDNSDILTNLLRDADLLNDLQVVVGVLSGGQFVVQDIAP